MTGNTDHARTALVTGVTGQDGVYLARLLADEGTHVVGTVRPGSAHGDRIAAYLPDITIVELDLRDSDRLRAILREHRPDEVYNLAAFTSVGGSWADPDAVAAINATAVTGLLSAALSHRDESRQEIRIFHASSGAAHGGDDSPYSAAKLAAEVAVAEFRAAHGLHACFANLHNHESPLRGEQFVTRKITQAVARIAGGDTQPLTLGNVDVRRDWGFAGDYVDAMRRMVRLDEPVDLEIGTGIDHSLRDLVALAFAAAGIDDAWQHIRQDSDLMRPTDAKVLVADPGPAQATIGWTAQVPFEELIAGMVIADITRRRTGVAEDRRYLRPAPSNRHPVEAL